MSTPILPPDVIRSILLYTNLNDIYKTITSFRLVLSESWWIRYFYYYVPSEYHSLFPLKSNSLDLQSTMFPLTSKEFIKQRGHHILRKVQRGGVKYLSIMEDLRWDVINGLLHSAPCIEINFSEGVDYMSSSRIGILIESDIKTKLMRITNHENNTVSLNSMLGVVRPLSEYTSILIDILFNGGRNYVETPFGDIRRVRLSYNHRLQKKFSC